MSHRAIVFDDGHHGLTHESMERATANSVSAEFVANSPRAVKFIGSSPQPRYRGERMSEDGRLERLVECPNAEVFFCSCLDPRWRQGPV